MPKQTKTNERKLKLKFNKTKNRKTLLSFHATLIRAYDDTDPYNYFDSHADNLRRIANLIGAEVGKAPIEPPEYEE